MVIKVTIDKNCGRTRMDEMIKEFGDMCGYETVKEFGDMCGVVLSDIYASIKHPSGMPETNYNAIKDLYVDAGITVKEYVEAGVSLGTMAWTGEGSKKVLKGLYSLAVFKNWS